MEEMGVNGYYLITERSEKKTRDQNETKNLRSQECETESDKQLEKLRSEWQVGRKSKAHMTFPCATAPRTSLPRAPVHPWVTSILTPSRVSLSGSTPRQIPYKLGFLLQ